MPGREPPMTTTIGRNSEQGGFRSVMERKPCAGRAFCGIAAMIAVAE